MPSLRSIRLLVTDFEASFLFYTDHMKLPVLYGDRNGPYAEFGDADGVSLSIYKKTIMLDLLKAEGGETEPNDDFMLIFKAEASVNEDSALLRAHAPQIIEPTDRKAWGVRAAQFRDPQGLLLELNKGFDE